MKEKTAKYNEIIAFVVLFVGMFCILLVFGDTQLYYDDGLYWSLGKSYDWNSTNLNIAFRGYLLPLIFFIAYKVGMIFGNEFIGLWLLSSITFSILHTVVFRRVTGMLGINTEDRNFTTLCGAIAGCANAVLFRGLYKYALSDIYAFLFLLLTIIVFGDLLKCDRIKPISRIVSSFVLGYLLYGMYNIRTVYLYISILLIIVFLVVHCMIEYRKYSYEVFMMILGILTGMFPMIRLNRVLFGKISWKIPTDELALFHIKSGISLDRYATYVGDEARYSSVSMFFYDKLGQKILEYEGIEEFTSWGEYIKLVFKYPLDFIGIYTRHIISMLYPIFPNQYIKSIDKDKSLLLILTFTLLFLCTVYLIKIYRFDKKNMVILGVILFPCICILPGAVESRFFIGAYYLIGVFATMGIKDVWLEIRKRKLSYVIGYIITFCIYIAGCGYMLASTLDGTTILSGL